MGWLIVRAVLAVTFAVAGLAKLASPSATRKSFVAFGVPDLVSAPTAVFLPLLELTVAGLLLVHRDGGNNDVGGARTCRRVHGSGARRAGSRREARMPLLRRAHLSASGGWHARAERAAWSSGVLRVRDGEGTRREHPSGARRRVGRAAWPRSVAAPVRARSTYHRLGAARRPERPPAHRASEALEASLRANASASAHQGEGRPVGSPAPDFLVWDEDETVYSLDDLRASGEPIVLTFIAPDCPGCRTVGPLLERAREAGTNVALITRGDRDPVPGALRQLDREVMAAYRAHVVPSAVVVDADGRIGSELARGADAVASLLAWAGSPV